MIELSKTIRTAFLTGKATTDSPASLNAPTYNFAFGSVPQQSFATWKEFDPNNTDPPTLRVVRNSFRARICYWLSVFPTSANWQTDLTEISVGECNFQKPTHTHCNDLYITPDNTIVDAGYNPQVGEKYKKVALYPDGSAVPYPIFEYFDDINGLELRLSGNSSGEHQRDALADYETVVIRSSDRRWSKTLSFAAFRNADESRTTPTFFTLDYQRWANESAGIKNPVWPQAPFQSFGTIFINRNFDWCPPIRMVRRVGATSHVEADCYLCLVYLDHLAPTSTFEIANRIATSFVNGPSDPLNALFPFSDIATPENGYYRPKSVPTNPNDLWVPTFDSASTGYDPPTAPAKCLFAVKRGDPS